MITSLPRARSAGKPVSTRIVPPFSSVLSPLNHLPSFLLRDLPMIFPGHLLQLSLPAFALRLLGQNNGSTVPPIAILGCFLAVLVFSFTCFFIYYCTKGTSSQESTLSSSPALPTTPQLIAWRHPTAINPFRTLRIPRFQSSASLHLNVSLVSSTTSPDCTTLPTSPPTPLVFIRTGSIPTHRNEVCPVCLEPLGDGRHAAGNCLHWIHETCLDNWLMRSGKNECPLCRLKLALPSKTL